MRATNMKNAISNKSILLALVAVALLLAPAAFAAAPGITGPTFNLTAQPAYISQPDGQMVYSWGYGCAGAPAGFNPPVSKMSAANCPSMQVPGPTLIVNEGDTVTVNLTNNLPPAAGNTSILFPGFTLTSVCPPAQQGLLTCEAPPNGTVTYTFVAQTPGTRAYYSGTQGDLQVEMGLYGAIIVLPANVPAACNGGLHAQNQAAQAAWHETDFRLAHAAYDNANTCYDREYLFQFAEMDPNIHAQALAQVNAANCTPLSGGALPATCKLDVPTEPYHPSYFLINGRSMPDDMDPNYAPQYPHQPYNGNPHVHPGEQVLLRIIGQGRWQHPFHEHANHVRILGRDGNLILTPDGQMLAGPALFTTSTTPGLAMDGIFYFTGRGLNWDMYGHNPASPDANAKLSCTPDANGYNTGFAATDTSFSAPNTAVAAAINYYEWCQDHNKPLQVHPFGDVGAGGPVTLPDSNILTNGAWFGGSPYLGPDATTRATGCSSDPYVSANGCGGSGTTPPSGTIANTPSSEAAFAYMWHSHNEREITTNNIFPGGLMMMLLVDSREFVIDEQN